MIPKTEKQLKKQSIKPMIYNNIYKKILFIYYFIE